MPKLIPLSRRHRRGRQTNLSTLLCAAPKGPNSLLNRTTRRKVSEEDMQTSSCSSTVMTNQEYSDESTSSLGNNFRSNCCPYAETSSTLSSSQVANTPSQLLLEATSSMNSQSIESELQASEEEACARRLKRPAASSCLSDLGKCISPEASTDFSEALSDKRSCKFARLGSPPSPSPYGQFVDMLIPDDEEEADTQQQRSFIPHSMCSASRARIFFGKDSDPYPRIRPQVSKRHSRSSRIPLAFNRQYQRSSNAASTHKIPQQQPTFNDFVLSFPELDETADRLGSLSF